MPKTITIPDINGWNAEKEEFVNIKGATITIEHSLISLQKWESKWCKRYFSQEEKTPEEIIDYVRCMTLTEGVDPELFNYMPDSVVKEIADYINAPMTATTFGNDQKPKGSNGRIGSDKVSAEIIYYWMIALNIPMECREWHLNQLITLIRVCEIKNTPPKKMNKNDILSRNRSLNAKRRAASHSKG